MKRPLGFVLGVCFAADVGLHSAPGSAAFDYSEFLRHLRVPVGFSITVAASNRTIRFPMFACLDDAGRLYVAESSGKDLYAGLKSLSRDCRVSRLEDKDGDGYFESSVVFAEKVTFPMGLTWRGGKLYLADPPDLVALTDENGDGRADQRTIVLHGFGHSDNGSLHGLTFGPDGLLYFTMGEPDGWKLPHGDGTFLEGSAGALFRSRPDGSHLEVICRGFENLVEIEFFPGGEIVGTDNWYQKPAGGLRDALIDCAPGGLYPYAPDRGTPLPRTGITLPPICLVPAVAQSGLTRLRTHAFPAEWRERLFVAEHNTRKVVGHLLRANGSTFSSETRDFVVGDHPDFHPADVLEDADGSILIVDTGGWYVEHCPTGRIRDSRAPGGIYRVRWTGAPKIDDPRGTKIDWHNSQPAELARLLRDPRPSVSERAATELARAKETEVLLATVQSGSLIDVRTRALWALASFTEGAAALRFLLQASDPTIVCVAARALALNRDKASGELLVPLLGSENPRVRRAGAEGLARCGSRTHLRPIADALVRAEDQFEQHACIAALLALANESDVRGLLSHDSQRVRSAALQLLDQPPFKTLTFKDLLPALKQDSRNDLVDRNEALQAAPLRLLERHSQWASDALPWIREQLTNTAGTADFELLSTLLTAFQRQPTVRDLISQLLSGKSPAPDAIRSALLRLLPNLSVSPPEREWVQAIAASLNDPNLRASALTAALSYREPSFETLLTGIAENAAIPAIQRLHAARASQRNSAMSKGVFELAIAAAQNSSDPAERLAALELLSASQLSAPQLFTVFDLTEKGLLPLDPLLPALLRSATMETQSKIGSFFYARLSAGWSPPLATLEQVLLACDLPRRQELRTLWEKNRAEMLSRLRDLRPLLSNGDPARGRNAFETAGCLNCHRVGPRGGLAGPDLTRIGAIRTGGDLLESIVYPSSSFAQGYEPFLVTKRDGEEIFGTLAENQPDGPRVRELSGAVRFIPAREIESIVRKELSVMPEGLDKQLSPEQFRDLLAYLQNLR